MLFRRRSEIQYIPLIPEIDKPMAEFSKAEAQKFFDSYIQNIPERIKYLCQLCKLPPYTDSATYKWNTGHLFKIWKWFCRIAQVQNDPETGKKRFSVMTEYILRDIGMYMGEMFVSTLPGLKWDYYTKPKSDIFVNEPVINGFVDASCDPPFHFRFEPIHMVRVKALNLLDGTQSSADLYDFFWHWAKYTQENTASDDGPDA